MSRVTIQEDYNQDDMIMYSELEVEKAAKRKLVSTSLLFISLLSRSLHMQELRCALSEWRGYCLQTQVAERAFNQILEINHKHSCVRYATGINMLERIVRKDDMKAVL